MEIVGAFIAAAIGVGLEVLLLLLLSRDASRHDIYLSRITKVLFLLTPTAPFVMVWYIVKRIQNRAMQGAPREHKRKATVKGTSSASSLSDPRILEESPEDLLRSLDARTRAHFMKDPAFRGMLVAYHSLPKGGKESSREMKKLVDYIQEHFVTFG